MAKTLRLYRLSLTTDDKTTTDRIDFNDSTKNDLKDANKENAWLTSIERIGPEGIGDDQPAEANLGSIDALGPVEDVYVLTGKITKTRGTSDDGQNQFLILLDLWSAEPKKSLNWPEGRFGLEDDTDHTNDLVPVRTGSNQIGLIWASYTKKTIFATNQTEIVIKFRVSKGDGT